MATAAAELVEAIDRFLEADARRRKATSTRSPELALRRALAGAFRAQGSAFLRKLAPLRRQWDQVERAIPRGTLLEAIHEDAWRPYFSEATLETLELFEGPMRQYARMALLAGARSAIAELRLESGAFDLESPAAVSYLEQHAAERVAGIHDTTRARIARIIRDGGANHRSYGQVARQIKGLFSEFAIGSPLEHIASRAELVAVTEIGDAYEAGNRFVVDGLIGLGLDMEKSWLTVFDLRVDPVCLTNESQGWIVATEPFASGDQQPTAHPGCRCTLLYRRKPD